MANKRSIQPFDTRDFLQEIALLLKHNLSIKDAVHIAGEDLDKSSMRKLVQHISADLAQGLGFADSLAKHPRYFHPFLTDRLRAAEQAGGLEQELRGVAAYRELLDDLDLGNENIGKALTYPIAVLAFAFVITAILMIFVVPVFGSMFNDFGASLPALTQLIIDISDVFVSDWYWLLAILIAAWMMAKYWLRQSPLGYRLFIGYVPIFGPLYHHIALGRILRTWAFMLAAGETLPKAVSVSAQVMPNIFFDRLCADLEQELRKNTRFEAALGRHPYFFPNKIVRAARIGAVTQDYQSLLEALAKFYAGKVHVMTARLQTLSEALIMAILAIVIGSLVIGMYLPIFKMGQVI